MALPTDCLQQDHNPGPGLTAAIAITDRNFDGEHVTVPPTTVSIYKLDNATRDTPQQLQLKISDYNPWQHIKAVSANRIKHTDVPVTAEEEFRTTLSVVDASTGELFRCLLQLTKSSKVSVSATDCPLCNVSVSIEIAPCKHTESSHHRYLSSPHRIVSEVGFPPDSGSLKLRFSFSEANCMYAIRFSIDSLISGDGKRCPGSTQTVPACVIRTIRTQPVSMKREPVLLEFQKPLKGQIYRNIIAQYREKVLSGQTTEVVSLTKVVVEEHCPDIKVVALCYQAMAMTKVGSYAKAQVTLDKAKVLVPMCINNILLLLKITRLQFQNVLRSNDFSSAHYYFESTKEVMSFAAPSPDTCAILSEQAYYLNKTNATKRTDLEKMYDQAIAHSRSATCQECTNILACGLYPCKALFHLKSYHPSPETLDEWEELQPSDEDLQKAADCLSCVRREDIDKRDVYKMEYYTAQADLHQWRGEFRDAYAFAQSADVYRCKYHNTDFLGIDKRLQALPELIQSSSMKDFV